MENQQKRISIQLVKATSANFGRSSLSISVRTWLIKLYTMSWVRNRQLQKGMAKKWKTITWSTSFLPHIYRLITEIIASQPTHSLNIRHLRGRLRFFLRNTMCPLSCRQLVFFFKSCHINKFATSYITNRVTRLHQQQPREEVRFRKNYIATDNTFAVNQLLGHAKKDKLLLFPPFRRLQESIWQCCVEYHVGSFCRRMNWWELCQNGCRCKYELFCQHSIVHASKEKVIQNAGMLKANLWVAGVDLEKKAHVHHFPELNIRHNFRPHIIHKGLPDGANF